MAKNVLSQTKMRRHKYFDAQHNLDRGNANGNNYNTMLGSLMGKDVSFHSKYNVLKGDVLNSQDIPNRIWFTGDGIMIGGHIVADATPVDLLLSIEDRLSAIEGVSGNALKFVGTIGEHTYINSINELEVPDLVVPTNDEFKVAEVGPIINSIDFTAYGLYGHDVVGVSLAPIADVFNDGFSYQQYDEVILDIPHVESNDEIDLWIAREHYTITLPHRLTAEEINAIAENGDAAVLGVMENTGKGNRLLGKNVAVYAYTKANSGYVATVTVGTFVEGQGDFAGNAFLSLLDFIAEIADGSLNSFSLTNRKLDFYISDFGDNPSNSASFHMYWWSITSGDGGPEAHLNYDSAFQFSGGKCSISAGYTQDLVMDGKILTGTDVPQFTIDAPYISGSSSLVGSRVYVVVRENEAGGRPIKFNEINRYCKLYSGYTFVASVPSRLIDSDESTNVSEGDMIIISSNLDEAEKSVLEASDFVIIKSKSSYVATSETNGLMSSADYNRLWNELTPVGVATNSNAGIVAAGNGLRVRDDDNGTLDVSIAPRFKELNSYVLGLQLLLFSKGIDICTNNGGNLPSDGIGYAPYIPAAGPNNFGVVKIGSGLEVHDGVISATANLVWQ